MDLGDLLRKLSLQHAYVTMHTSGHVQANADHDREHDDQQDHHDIDPLRDPRARTVVDHVLLVVDIG